MKKKSSATSHTFTVEISKETMCAIIGALSADQLPPGWIPEDFVARAIENQIEMLRLCGSAELVDGNLRPLIPVTFPRPESEACQPTSEPLARILRLVPPPKAENKEV